MTMGEDNNNGKEDKSKDIGNKMAMTARMTGEDGEDNRQGQQ